MSTYTNFATKLAMTQESGNMQRYLGTLSGSERPEYRKLLKEIDDYECSEFVSHVHRAATGIHEAYFNARNLIRMYIEGEDVLNPLLSRINEDCLNDPLFSKALINGDFYAKEIGSEHSQLLYYPENSYNSKYNDLDFTLLFIPSASNNEPNKFRINLVEHLAGEQEYPLISVSVDIGDDGSISYPQPTLSDKDEESNIVSVPTDMSRTHIRFNEKGIDALKDMFGYVFEKTGLKENTENKRTSL